MSIDNTSIESADASRRKTLQGMAGILAGMAAPALISAPVWAQDKFPSRPITLIAPWPPGGSSDAVMRAFAESASRALGVSVIVDNRPGAGGTLGATAMVNAKPDGYMLTQLPLGVYRLPHMQKMAFDPVKDLTHIGHHGCAVQDPQGNGGLCQG
jgi:tripartite-type tricarboxylate transporter receptor subunit TctC